MLLGKFGFEFLNFQMNRERQKAEFDAPKSFCSVFFSVSYDQLRVQNENICRFILCMNSTDNWSPDYHPIESRRVRFSESIGSWPWDKTETTTRNIEKRARICLLLAVNSAFFLGQFSINIFLSCSHRHTRLKKTFLTLQASNQK